MLGINDILIDDKSGSFGRVGDALSDLANGAEFSKEVEELFRRYVVAVEIFMSVWHRVLWRSHHGGTGKYRGRKKKCTSGS